MPMRATGDPQLYLATVRHDSCLPWRQLKMIIGEGNTHSKGYSVPDAKRRSIWELQGTKGRKPKFCKPYSERKKKKNKTKKKQTVPWRWTFKAQNFVEIGGKRESSS